VLTRALVCGYMAAARLLELRLSRHNIEESGPSGEGQASRRSYPLIVALHSIVIGGTLLAGSRRARRHWLAALLLCQPLRLWVLLTLGRRWNVRGAVSPVTEVATSGPYRYVRHPNYTVVAVELFTLPAAFGLTKLALSASATNAGLLAIRIRDEEELLMKLPGYRDHFETRPRFLPGLF
jgi:methyltransferase